MAIWHWSTTAADNDDADATINWAEGQAASSVNNSGRAMMAVIAAYRDALGGAKTTGGSSNAYTLTTGLSQTSYQSGLLLGFKANHTNTGAATIAIDGLATKSLKTGAGAELSASTIVAGGIYLVSYETSADAVLLLNPQSDLDADLAEIAGLSPSNDDIIQQKAGVWTNRTMAQLIADLAALGTTFQPLDTELTALAGLATTSGNVPFASAGTWGVLDITDTLSNYQLKSLDTDISLGEVRWCHYTGASVANGGTVDSSELKLIVAAGGTQVDAGATISGTANWMNVSGSSLGSSHTYQKGHFRKVTLN